MPQDDPDQLHPGHGEPDAAGAGCDPAPYLPYDPVEFYVVMNMMFTDYYGVAKKYGQEKNADFFVELSKGWLDDKDVAAGDKKTAMYYREIVV